MSEKNINKKEYSELQTFAAITVMSFFSVLFQAVMQNGINPLGYLSYITSPLIWLFNFIPVFVLTLFIFCLTDSLRTTFAIFNIPFTVFLLINEFKILFRDEPFKPNDITLINEASNMLENYSLKLNFKIVIMTVVMIAAIILVIKNIRNAKVGILKRIIGIVICIAVALPSYIFIYSNKTIYDDINIMGNIYHESDVFANKGFVYSFISSLKGAKYLPPAGYSKEKAEKILDSNKIEEEELPNIIAIMSESLFDAQSAENLEFLPGMNPYDNLNKLKETSAYGKIFVPGFAGGTSQTEFEFLCGSNISLIDSSLPTIYKTHILKNTYGLVSEFGSRDYKTVAIHPGHPWFYNRQNVYKLLGFDEFITGDDLPHDAPKKHFYICDSVTTELIKDNYKKHLEETPDKGYFGFTVTIQNHGPYSQSKPKEAARIVRPEGISDSDYNILENYMNNVSDAVKLLYDVCEFTDTIDKPTVVIFFGDHLPYFDPEYKDYEAIGYDIKGSSEESLIRQHSTPFVIRGNAAFRKSHPGYENKDLGLISSNFLAAEMLKYIGADLSPYFKFTKDLSEKVSVISSDLYIQPENVYLNKPSGELKELLNDYRTLQYYNLNDYDSK